MAAEPYVSIVIPTRNRPSSLDACVRALAALETPHEQFEVLIVNDGGLPPLDDDVVRHWHGSLDLTVVHQTPSGPAAARNRGASLARGMWLAFTDDDCQPAPDWLGTLVSAMRAFPTHALGGRTVNALPDNRFATASQLVVDHFLAANNQQPANTRFLASNNLAVPTAQYRAMGGFDPTFRAAGGEDRAFCDDWHHDGYDLVYLPAAVVWHAHDLNLRTFWQQHVAYGRGAFWCRARAAGAARGVAPASFYYQLVTAPFTQRIPHPASVARLLLLAQVATVTGYFHARSTNKGVYANDGHGSSFRNGR